VQFDPSHVPTPVLEKRLSHTFRVALSTVVKYGFGRSLLPTLTFATQIRTSARRGSNSVGPRGSSRKHLDLYRESKSHRCCHTKGDRLQCNSTGTRLAKLAFLPLTNRSACWLSIHLHGCVIFQITFVTFVLQILDRCSFTSLYSSSSVGPCEGWDPLLTYFHSTTTKSPLLTHASFMVSKKSCSLTPMLKQEFSP
jgi:hypothetical protein